MANNIPLSKAKKRLCSMIPEKNKIERPIYHVSTIAIPPPFGVGKSCKLLSFGMLIILFFKANRLIKYVNTNEQNPREIINSIIFNWSVSLFY